jgi:hypothetical protein
MNVARGKAVTQSTSNPSFDNSLAVDGVRTGENFSTTVPVDLNPYLEVDLGKEYAIEQIKDFTRDNCCSHERDYNITFEILDANRNSVYTSSVFNPWDGIGSANVLEAGAVLQVDLIAELGQKVNA